MLTFNFCNNHEQASYHGSSDETAIEADYASIGDMAVPAGYRRVAVERASFGEWLRGVKLKRDSKIYLYNGRLKYDQSGQFAVLDVPVGNKDLQQCADAILRLRTEYFFDRADMDSIHFKATDGTELSFARWLKGERYKLRGNKLLPFTSAKSPNNKRIQLEQFLEIVFSYCATISLNKETWPIDNLNEMKVGDVFIKAGSPGHAMIVVDLAVNHNGEKIFLLAQGLMPAQDIHIVKNPTDEKISPWYKVKVGSEIITPQWVFYRNQFRRW